MRISYNSPAQALKPIDHRTSRLNPTVGLKFKDQEDSPKLAPQQAPQNSGEKMSAGQGSPSAKTLWHMLCDCFRPSAVALSEEPTSPPEYSRWDLGKASFPGFAVGFSSLLDRSSG